METENKHEDAEKKLKDAAVDSIDDLGESIKKISRKFFDACVTRTAEVFSDVFDDYLNKTKEKINKKGEEDD